MPGYVIHLVEAELIIRILQNKERRYSEKWKERFRWGSLIPDADKNVQTNTHFWKIDKKINLKKVPNISIFEKKYRKELFNREKNPVLFGYYAHLYLDKEFSLEYLKNNVEFYDLAGEQIDDLSRAATVKIKNKEGQLINADDFCEALHDDYTKMNKYFENKYEIKMPDQKIRSCVEELQGLSLQRVVDKYTQYEKEFVEEQELTILDKDKLEDFLIMTAEKIVSKTEKVPTYWFWKGGNAIKNQGFFGIIKGMFAAPAVLCGGQRALRFFYPERQTDDKGIFDAWYDMWEKTANCMEMNFAGFFSGIYFETYRKMESNKQKNFFYKFLYIGMLILALIIYILLFIINMNQSGETIYSLIENGFILAVFALIMAIILKWLDIKKYQETWARHQQHIRLLQKEMLYYIYGMGDYAKCFKGDNRTFMEKVLEIENKNVMKFVDNMENKEVKLGDNLKDMVHDFIFPSK